MMEKGCIFCRILKGDIPSYRWYEDEYFAVILDRFPKCVGHTLIVPKTHAATIFDLPEEYASRLMPLAKTLSERLFKAYKFKGLNLLQNNGELAGQTVNHFHLHLIPRYDLDDMVVQWKTVDPSPEEFEAAVDILNRSENN